MSPKLLFPARPRPDDSGVGPTPGAVVVGLPATYSQGDDFSCGPVVGWTALKAFRPEIPYKEFFRRCRPSVSNGTPDGRVCRALRHYGLRVTPRNGLGHREIVDHLRRGRLIMTTVFWDEDVVHWMLIYGAGVRPNRVYLSGWPSACSRRRWAYGEFRRNHWDPERFGMIIAGELAVPVHDRL